MLGEEEEEETDEDRKRRGFMDTYVRKNVDVILYVQTKYFQCWWRGYPWLCAGSASNTLIRDIAEEYKIGYK